MDYIGYKKSVGDLVSSGTAAASSGARVFATSGADISADIALAMSGVQFLGDLWNQWTSHPARDARDFIKNHKPLIANLDPYNRLVNVIAFNKKINTKAIDVAAGEWLLWYRQNYPNDYQTLKVDAKKYWNDYLYSIESQFPNGNNLYNNLNNAMFTTSELNYNATPTEAASNIFSSVTSGKTNWVLYGAIGVGIIVLIKMLKK